MAIAFFFVIAQFAGAFAPWVFGYLISESPGSVFVGFLVGAACMIGGAIVADFYAVDAEGASLESIAPPISNRAVPQ